ncbi:MAG: polysaccharide deacetylase family protein [Thermoplasmata archaeon]
MIGATKTRGRFSKLGRAVSVLRNYGMVSSNRLEARLHTFRRFLKNNRCPATFACPSALLRRGRGLVNFLKDFDVAIHGMDHIDYKNMNLQRIESDLNQAISDYESVDLEPKGFRAPYLRWNRDLIRALCRSGLTYDSSNSIFWDVGGRDLASLKEIQKLLNFYSSTNEEDTPSLPRIEEGLVRIPVSLPDDEILVERLMISHPTDLFAHWSEMLKKSYEKSELLVLQIHPERFQTCEEALGRLLEEVRNRNIWVGNLEEIASWWLKRNAARLSVDSDMRIDYENPNSMVVKIWNEIKEGGEMVPRESLIRISSKHPLYRRALELGFVFSEDSSSGFPIDEAVVQESDLIEIGKRRGLLQKGLWPHDYRSAFCLTGDIDALTVGDFLKRSLMRMSSSHRRGE